MQIEPHLDRLIAEAKAELTSEELAQHRAKYGKSRVRIETFDPQVPKALVGLAVAFTDTGIPSFSCRILHFPAKE